jgi:hypothetical protein
MERNEKIREQIFEIIKNQLKDNHPPFIQSNFMRTLKGDLAS